ncbi:MAG TPA: hypothetical protein VKZ57_02215 [Sphingobacterium sp.]|jgi:hypothetical protein|nr:hypothetical protein [Sphingobacterium sp.]
MKNNFILGTTLGVIFPLSAYLANIFTSIQTSFFAHKPIALYIIAATINLIAVRFLYRQGKEATANGVMLATFLAMVVLIVFMREMVFSYS